MVVVVVVVGGQSAAVALVLAVGADGDDAVRGGGGVADDDGLQGLDGAAVQGQAVRHAPVAPHHPLPGQQLRLRWRALLHALLHRRKLRRRRFLVRPARGQAKRKKNTNHAWFFKAGQSVITQRVG